MNNQGCRFTEIEILTTSGFEQILGQSSGMIKQTEHFKNFNFNCFTYGNTQANCETIYITLLVPFTFWILKTNMGSVCLQDYVLADSQCVLLVIHASTAGCLLSWFMYHLGCLQLSVRYYYTGYNIYAHYLAIFSGFGCILKSYNLCINDSLLSACFSLFSFILIKYLIIYG